jgi:hypothetical protein
MTTQFTDMDDVRRANAAIGHHWFDPDTLSFFSSRVGDTLYGGRYFVSSEKPPASLMTWDGQRRYTVREALPDGKVQTVGEFGEWPTRAAAVARARYLAGEVKRA